MENNRLAQNPPSCRRLWRKERRIPLSRLLLLGALIPTGNVLAQTIAKPRTIRQAGGIIEAGINKLKSGAILGGNGRISPPQVPASIQGVPALPAEPTGKKTSTSAQRTREEVETILGAFEASVRGAGRDPYGRKTGAPYRRRRYFDAAERVHDEIHGVLNRAVAGAARHADIYSLYIKFDKEYPQRMPLTESYRWDGMNLFGFFDGILPDSPHFTSYRDGDRLVTEYSKEVSERIVAVADELSFMGEWAVKNKDAIAIYMEVDRQGGLLMEGVEPEGAFQKLSKEGSAPDEAITFQMPGGEKRRYSLLHAGALLDRAYGAKSRESLPATIGGRDTGELFDLIGKGFGPEGLEPFEIKVLTKKTARPTYEVGLIKTGRSGLENREVASEAHVFYDVPAIEAWVWEHKKDLERIFGGWVDVPVNESSLNALEETCRTIGVAKGDVAVVFPRVLYIDPGRYALFLGFYNRR